MPAGAIAGSGVLSAGASLFGSSSAAKSQEKAAQIAAQTQMAMYNQTRSDLGLYRDLGSYAGGQLQNRLVDLTSPIVMDQATVERTPGYQFNLSQGLRAAQSSAAARGLGLSGAAIKAATDYATGLADSTYQNQFNNAVTNQTNAFNKLYQTTALGQNAAAGTGAAALATGKEVGTNLVGAGNARGAGAIAAGNAFGSAFGTGGQYLNKLLSASGGYWGDNSDINAGAKIDDSDWL
jgi:hypothetical protein